jgi:hypothetical protein
VGSNAPDTLFLDGAVHRHSGIAAAMAGNRRS